MLGQQTTNLVTRFKSNLSGLGVSKGAVGCTHSDCCAVPTPFLPVLTDCFSAHIAHWSDFFTLAWRLRPGLFFDDAGKNCQPKKEGDLLLGKLCRGCCFSFHFSSWDGCRVCAGEEMSPETFSRVSFVHATAHWISWEADRLSSLFRLRPDHHSKKGKNGAQREDRTKITWSSAGSKELWGHRGPKTERSQINGGLQHRGDKETVPELSGLKTTLRAH